jgi:biotin carboxylase
MGRHVLLVGGRGHELPKVERLGLRYSMVQTPERATAGQRAGAVRYQVLDYRDPGAVLPVARAWHAADPFDAVVSFTEYGLEPASRCALALGLPGANLEAVRATRDKTRTRALLDRHGLSPVRHRVCGAPEDALDFLAGLDGGPMVLKPTDGGLSEGVFVVGSARELAERWPWTSAVAGGGPVLAEEYLPGPEFSVESVSRDGVHEIVMVTEKLTAGEPGFVELGHQMPARLDPGSGAAVEKLVTAFLDAIGQRTGPVHTELRLTPAGPRLIEAQTRVGGDQIWEMCELVSGVDMISETLAALTGLPLRPRTPAAPAAAIRFFGHQEVRITAVSGVERARSAPGVVRLVCTLEAGRTLGRLDSSEARQGYVLCTGADTAAAVAAAEAARDLVRVSATAR